MKKIISLLLVAIMVIAVFAGCKGQEQNNGNGKDEKKTIKIGIAAPNATHGWVAGVAYYAEKYCKDNNLEYKVTTSADAAAMASALSDLQAWGATVIVAYPQWTGMETAIQEVIDAGIKVVNFDVEVACKNIYKVTGDNYGMGYEGARYILDKVGKDSAATIAVLDVPSSGSVSEQRKKGFYDYLASVGFDKSNVFEMAGQSFTREIGYKDMADALNAHKQIDAVFSLDDETSIGAVQAISEAGRTDIKAITGGGGCQAYFKMIDDPQYAGLGLSSALYSPAMIQDAIKVGIKLMNGEKSEDVIVIPTTIVTVDNVKNYLDPNNDIY